MGTLLFILGAGALALAGLGWLAALGFRNGDRPLDVRVSAELRDAGQPDEPRPVVLAEIRNPSPSAVMVGLSARATRRPAWLCGHGSAVPRRTARRGLRAGRYETVGVVPARGTTRYPVPVPAAGRRYQLTAVIGQDGGRLRVQQVPVDRGARIRLPVADLAGRRPA
jgi:hypothetical protein